MADAVWVSAAPLPFRERHDELPPGEIARRYRTLIDHLPLVVYVDALDSVSSNIFTSPQIEPLLGYSVEEWKADTDLFARLLHEDDRERVLAAHAHTHETHEPLSIEYRLVSRDGKVIWLRDEGVIVLDDHGRPLYLQGYLLDITREREAELQLRQQALYDTMTGLANRAFFHERLRHAIKLRHEEGEATGLLYIDLDDFKGINDRWGHDLGDEVLREVGRRIEQSVRPGDTAARLGGDEFAVVLTEPLTPEEAVGVAERLLREIGRPMESGSGPLYINASVGIAFGDHDETLLKEADIAMYRAKANRDLGYAFFDPELDAPVSGSVSTLEEGRLSIIVGGDRQTFERVKPILLAIGPTVTYIGENGSAVLMKIATNLNLATQILAFSEGVLLAERGGIPRELAVHVLLNSVIASPMLKYRGPFVVQMPKEAWFDVTLMQKDLSLALDLGRELAVPLPTTATANQWLTAARGIGLGEQDFAVVCEVLARLTGRRQRMTSPAPGADPSGREAKR